MPLTDEAQARQLASYTEVVHRSGTAATVGLILAVNELWLTSQPSLTLANPREQG